MRRAASLSLMIGWLAFLLFSSLQVCCKLSAAEREPGSTGAAMHTSAEHGQANHEPANHQEVCQDIVPPTYAAVTTPDRPNYDSDAVAAPVALQSFDVRNEVYVAHLGWPPPRPASYYRRASRILI